MSDRRGRSTSPRRRAGAQRPTDDDEASFVNTRQLEALGRTVHATASQLISSNFSGTDSGIHESYHSALGHINRSMQRPSIQRSVFNLAKANPRELIRSHFNSTEIEHRAITYIPDDLLRNVKETSSPFSLFEGFQASLPEDALPEKRRRHGKQGSKSQKLLDAPEEEHGPPKLAKLKKMKQRSDHRLEMMGIRKTMCASEIKEIDTKIANLNTMRKVVLDRLAGLEQEEHDLEQEVGNLAEKLEVLEEELEDTAVLDGKPTAPGGEAASEVTEDGEQSPEMNASFMSESVYGRLPKTPTTDSPKSKRRKAPRTPRKVSMPVLHEHMQPGSQIREMPAHNDMITALDFDAPFGTMVTAALDDTVRVWDLSAGRCMGMLEGHLSSVRCLQVEDNLVATGSMDASIKLWDLSQADYVPPPPSAGSKSSVSDDHEEPSATGGDLFGPIAEDDTVQQPAVHNNAMEDCHVLSLSGHVAEVTALNFRGNTLVSGSADKTLRQWDLETGRCVQTLDVLWAAAQPTNVNNGSTSGGSADSWWRPTAGRLPAAEADFVGALQVFETALACGTADGMVRLWDLRSGMVHRSLVGHTGPITALQFDDVYLVTGSQDRSIRIWDLRTGGIHDAFAYDQPVTSMTFDSRRIVSAVGEDVVKVYDKAEGQQWDCGPGVNIEEGASRSAAIERVKIKDGYMIEGRKDGIVGEHVLHFSLTRDFLAPSTKILTTHHLHSAPSNYFHTKDTTATPTQRNPPNPSATMSTNNSGLTARDIEVLCAMCQSLKSKPDTDMDKFATLAGFSTPASAYTKLRKVLKKVMGDGAVSSPEAKKGAGRKRKTADIEDEDDAEETPSKKKASPKKKSKTSDETGNIEEDPAIKNEPEDGGADELA
ncbi:hypothetical protein Q7P37_007052 [Cladosporium fusiforme]